MSEYTHLTTEVANSRYAMAAPWFKGLTGVIEIGGANSCIADFLDPGTYKHAVIIDPAIDLVQTSGFEVKGLWCNRCGSREAIVGKRKAFFQEANLDGHLANMYDSETLGLCMMGVELICDEDDLVEHIKPVIERSSVICLDHVVSNRTAEHQIKMFEEWAAESGSMKAIELILNFKYDAGYTADIVPSFHKSRRFVVYVNPRSSIDK